MRAQTALITGASSGIGSELAKLAAADGCGLVLVSRRQDRLEALASDLSVAHGIAARVLTADLARPGSPRRIFEDLEKERVAVDILVNNAGLGLYGEFSTSDLDRQLEVVEVNVVALTELTRLLLPGMIERGRGRILNVASTAAFQPGPYMAVYYATKAYVLSFSEALAEELKETGVTVSALCPGPVTTEFQEVAGVDAALFPKPLVMEASDVARAGWAAAKRGKRVVIPGIANRVMKETVRFSPRRLVTAAAGRLQKKRDPGKKRAH
ncbi:MAG TPA: SDR family oxidoreductase [Thermoanaerobaculia bacterium]|nr:SDR family oxidoreductase [Thermoanaerobaculia bacterium]